MGLAGSEETRDPYADDVARSSSAADGLADVREGVDDALELVLDLVSDDVFTNLGGESDRSKTLTTPSTFWPMSRLMTFLTVVIALFSCRASCRSSPEQFDREVVAAVGLVHEMELAAALLPGKRERDATLEIAQTSKHLAVANERVQSDCGGDQHC